MNRQNQTILIAAFYNLTVVTVLCSLGVMTATYIKNPFKADAAIFSAEHLHSHVTKDSLCQFLDTKPFWNNKPRASF